jgi:hypothetical protein
MRQRALQSILLVHAIEQNDLSGDALSLEDRVQASRDAAEGRPLPAAGAVPEALDADSERYLARRADALLARLRVRSPGIDHILAASAGPTGLDQALLLLGLALGLGAAFVGGSRIDIFAYPLVALIVWNLAVYLMLLVRTLGRGRHGVQPPPPAATDPAAAAGQRDGFIRRWLARRYANRVRARIDALIAHSIGFNAPLAPGLRRFAADWCEVGRPLFRERTHRLLHAAAILVAIGLMAGYGIRGWVLRQVAGWSTSVFGPASAHAALVTLYGPASAISGVPVASANTLQALAWTGSARGGGAAGPWLYLIAWTALLYIVLPRLIAVVVTTVSLWRRSATLRTPASFPSYLRAVLRTSPASPQPPPAAPT